MVIPSRREKEKREVRYASAKKRAEDHEVGFQPTTYNPPDNAGNFYFNKKGVFRLDIIPFRVGEGNPFADEGEVHYERTYFAHKNVGPDEEMVVCSRKTFGEPCPICEKITKLRRDPSTDSELLQELRPKERQLWQVIDVMDRDKGIQILECSYFNGLGQLVDNKIKDSEEDDGYEKFFHLEDGMTLKVSVVQESYRGGTYYKPTNVEMKQRKQQYEVSILKEGYCLDSLLKKWDYDKLKKTFNQISEERDEEEKEDKKEKSSDYEIEDFVMYKGKECEITKISGDGTTLTLEDEDGKTYKGVKADEITTRVEVKKSGKEESKEEDEEEDEKQQVKRKKVSDEDDEEDEEEDEEDIDTDEDEDEEDDEKKDKVEKRKKVSDEDDEDDKDDNEDDDKDEEPIAGRKKRKGNIPF